MLNIDVFNSYINHCVFVRVGGVTKSDLAKAIGISRTALWRKLAGKAEWTISEINTAATVFSLPLEYCIEGNPDYAKGIAFWV